jgi:putative Mn2+ efflux pump MntP
MSFLSVMILSLGLAMDCLAVSIASGAAVKQVKIHLALRVAFFFGFFQSLMAALGMTLGWTLKDLVEAYDHWLAFGLLGGIGAKMIFESFKMESEKSGWNPCQLSTLTVLAVATSIDALAVGISLSFVQIESISTIIAIGLVSFVLSFVGIYTGEKMGHFFENKIEFAGGVILFLIGFKILLEHLGVC